MRTLFPFICAYVDKAPGYIEYVALMKVKTMNSGLLTEIHFRSTNSNTDFGVSMSSLNRRLTQLVNTMVRLFEDHYECGLFRMEFHPVDKLCDDIKQCSTIQCFRFCSL